jgi:hypothetical protein
MISKKTQFCTYDGLGQGYTAVIDDQSLSQVKIEKRTEEWWFHENP